MRRAGPKSIEAARTEFLPPPLRAASAKEILIGLGIGVILVKLLLVSLEIARYQRALPAALETTGIVTSGGEPGFFESLLPIRHEPCGGFVFGLSGTTGRAIDAQGLGFFKDVRKGRAVQANNRSGYEFSYEPWQETPLPDDWTRTGMWLGLHCMGWRLSPLGSQIFAAAQEHGSYFTTAPSKLLLVLPRPGLVVLTYRY
jgi:hypothetical protein